MTSISDGSRSTNSSRLSQFGIYKSIDARTEEFLRLSRKRQLRQGCACAALSTAITVTIVVAGLLVYEYTTTLDVKSHHEPGRSYWHGLFNTSSAFDPAHYKARITVDPTTLKLLPIILKALNHNRYLEKVLKEHDAKKLLYPLDTKQTPEHSFHKRLLSSAKMRTNPSVQVKYNFPVVKPSIKNKNSELFRKNEHWKHQENVLKYFNKMIDSKAFKAPLPLTEKENAKSPFFENPVDIVGTRNRTAIRESKAFFFTEDQKISTKKPIKKHNDLKKSTVTFKNSTVINTLEKPNMPTIPMKEQQQVPKTATNKLAGAGAGCVCTMKLLNLLNKLINNIQNVIPELKLYEKSCHEKVKFETIKPMTTVPVKLLTKKLTTPTTPTDLYTSTIVPRTASTTITIPTTIPTTVAVPATIPTTTYLETYHVKGMKDLHNVETSSEKKTMFGDLSEETINAEYINRELLKMRDTEYTTTKSPIEQTYSFTTAPTTKAIKSYTAYRSDPFYYTNSNKIEELLNEFKQKVEKNIMRAEYDQGMEIPKIINDNRNIEPKLIPGVESLNPRTLEGFNRMKATEDKSETKDVNSFKSILIQNTEKFHDTKRSSSFKNAHNNTQTNNAINNGQFTTKPILKEIDSTSTATLNKFDEVFKNYADVNALISRTQNLSNATIYELYKKKEEDNSTATDYDEVIEGIESEQMSPSMRRSKQRYNKNQETKHNNKNTDIVNIRSMLPVSRSSYLEIHRSVPKQDAQEYDNTELSNNADRK